MAITTLGLTGFEHGFIGAGAQNGGGLFDAAPGSGWSASTSSPRNGSYCAHLVAPANTATQLLNNITGSPTKLVGRFGFKVAATGINAQVFGSNDASTGTPFSFKVLFGNLVVAVAGTGSGQAAITANIWHLVEFQFDSAAKTLDWKLNGVAQTRCTGSGTVNAPTAIGLGTKNTADTAYTADYDDVIIGTWTVAGTDWYGDGKVLAQRAGVDGTHATITSLSPGDAGTAYSGTPTTVNTMVDDTPGGAGWSATRSTTDNIALRTATVGAYAAIGPATTAETTTANAVKAILSYSSSTATANLAACDVRNSAGAVSELWGLTGGVGKAYNVTANNFKSAIVTRPAAGWTVAEVNAIRFRFGGCTSADISPVPTCQALMLEVDWLPPPPPTATSVARVSLASGPTPLTRTAHTIEVRARKASGSGTVLLSAALYEGATNRSGDLTGSVLTTSFANYTLPIPDFLAALITDYSDLELRFWADCPEGDTVAVEVARISLTTPAGAGGPGSNPLAGAVNVAVAVTGSLTVDRPLAGAVNVAVSVTGTLTNTPPALPLAGAVNVAVSTTGTLTGRATLAGAAINVAVADTGTLTSRAGLVSAGTNVATVTGSPAVSVTAPLTGAVNVTVSDTGTVTSRATLAGTVNVAVSTTGTITASLPLAGAVNVTTVIGAAGLSVTAPLAGAVNVTSSVTGTAVKHNPLTGAAINVAVSSTGTLTNTPPGGVAVAGDVAVTTQVTGSLSVTVPLVAAGVNVAVSDTGTLTGRAALTGAVSVAVSDTGTLTGRATLAGAVNVAVSVTGTLTNTPPGGNALAGFVSVAVAVTGTAVTQNPLAAAVNVDTAVTGTVTTLRPLTAASSVAVSVTGTLTNLPPGANALTGNVNVDTSVTGSLLLSKPLAGAVTVAVTLTGAGGSLRALAGQSLVGTLVTGTVSARAVLAGPVDVTVTTGGSVLVIKPLAGAVLTAVTVGQAVLTNTGPIVSVSILEAASYAAVGEDAGAGSVLTAGNTSTVVERAMGASVPSSGGSVALIE